MAAAGPKTKIDKKGRRSSKLTLRKNTALRTPPFREKKGEMMKTKRKL